MQAKETKLGWLAGKYDDLFLLSLFNNEAKYVYTRFLIFMLTEDN